MIQPGRPKTKTELRKFGVQVGIAFGVIAAITLWRDHIGATRILGGISAVLVVGGLVAPAALRPIEKAWMGLALVLSKITTPIFLGIVYFLVLTPAGLLRRTLSRNPLRHSGEDGTYWHDRAASPRGDLERQF